MPKGEFYRGLSLPAAVERLASHHYDPENRHISEDEHAMLLGAAEELRAASMSKAELDEMLGESYEAGRRSAEINSGRAIKGFIEAWGERNRAESALSAAIAELSHWLRR